MHGRCHVLDVGEKRLATAGPGPGSGAQTVRPWCKKQELHCVIDPYVGALSSQDEFVAMHTSEKTVIPSKWCIYDKLDLVIKVFGS
jgi:hypothetical protein